MGYRTSPSDFRTSPNGFRAKRSVVNSVHLKRTDNIANLTIKFSGTRGAEKSETIASPAAPWAQSTLPCTVTLILHTPNKHSNKESGNANPTQKSAVNCSSDPAKEMDEHDQEQLSGFIFMCNGRTKPQCYMYRVFGLPAGKLEVVEKIKPGMKLFLFDFELKLLYGIYEATSVGTLDLEQTAFNGRFPAQVRFKIYRDCLPLHESSFRHAIEYNYQKGFKFKQELNKQQVVSLLSLFRPLTAQAPAALQPVPLQAVQNQSGLPFLKDTCAQVLESQQIQRTGHQQGIGRIHPVDPNTPELQHSYVQPVSETQNILQGVPSLQQHYFGSSTNADHSHVLMTPNYRYYLAEDQQLYAAGNPTRTVPGQYDSYGTMGISYQLGMDNIYQLPIQREEETVQQQESVIQYYNSDPSSASPYVPQSVLPYTPTMGVPEAANGTLPFAYSYPFAGAAPTHH
ncbi:hypothetical protein PTKIN_Ptkin05aG0209700 [Pterospermum kingtungense]